MEYINEDFNIELYYLGAVCKRLHYYNNSIHSLRQKSNRTCVICLKENSEKYCRRFPERRQQTRRNWTIKNSEKPIPYIEQKSCNKCKQILLPSKFYPNGGTADRLHPHCIDCDKVFQQKIRDKKRKPRQLIDSVEKRRKSNIRNRRYKQTEKGKANSLRNTHVRRARIIGSLIETYTLKQLHTRFQLFDLKCSYCGKIGEKLTIDHFIPISKDGGDILQNIVPACGRCNYSKNNKLPTDWYFQQPFFSLEKWEILLKLTNAFSNSESMVLRRCAEKFGLGQHLYRDK